MTKGEREWVKHRESSKRVPNYAIQTQIRKIKKEFLGK